MMVETAHARVDQLCLGIKRLPTQDMQRRYLARMLEQQPAWEVEIASVYAAAGLKIGGEHA